MSTNFGIPQGWKQMPLPPKMDGSPDAPNRGVGNIYQGPSQSIGVTTAPPLLIGFDLEGAGGNIIESPTAPPPPHIQQKVETKITTESFVQNLKADEAEKALALLEKKVTYLKAQKVILKKLKEGDFLSNPVKDMILIVLGFNKDYISYVEVPYSELNILQTDPKYVTAISSVTLEEFEKTISEYYLDIHENLIIPIISSANQIFGRDLNIFNSVGTVSDEIVDLDDWSGNGDARDVE